MIWSRNPRWVHGPVPVGDMGNASFHKFLDPYQVYILISWKFVIHNFLSAWLVLLTPYGMLSLGLPPHRRHTMSTKTIAQRGLR